MAEVQVDKNLYYRMDKTYTTEEGEEEYGVWELGYRDPSTHVIVFEGDEAPQLTAPTTVEDHGQVTLEVSDEPAFAQPPEDSE